MVHAGHKDLKTRVKFIKCHLLLMQDVSDLFGADLPVEGGEGGHFSWRDGPFLRALKAGHWIVLDEVCACTVPWVSLKCWDLYSSTKTEEP